MTSAMLTTRCCAAASASPVATHPSRPPPSGSQPRCVGPSLAGWHGCRARRLVGRAHASSSRRARLTGAEAEERFRREQEAELVAMQKLSMEWWKFDSHEVDPEHLEERLEEKNVDPATVAALILGGGIGNGLYPLTERMAKGAIHIGGSYRLIDIPLSNCLNSGIFKMYVFTQYNSSALNNYISHTYDFGFSFGNRGFVEVLTATITPESKEWFGGTADAVRRYAWAVDTRRNLPVEDILILKTDHLYRMDYQELVRAHRNSGADVTLCTYPVSGKKACKMALVKLGKGGRITKFEDKPSSRGYKMKKKAGVAGLPPPRETRDATMLDRSMQVDGAAYGLPSSEGGTYLASMGIYVFKKRVLFDLLDKDYPNARDFGADIFPNILNDLIVMSHTYNGFWEDVSTIKSFLEAQIKLSSEAYSFFDVMPSHTKPKYLPASRFEGCKVKDTTISSGCVLAGCTIKSAVIGDRVVATDCYIENAVIMEAERYETREEVDALLQAGKVPLGIGSGTVIKNAIVSVNCRIGKNCTITNEGGVQNADFSQNGFAVRDGIVVIMPGTTLPDGFVI